MKPIELASLLPAGSWEDFPTDLESDQADQLLVAWTTLWHPALIAAAQKAPAWYQADSPPDQSEAGIYLCPAFSADRVPADWWERQECIGSLLHRVPADRAAALADVLSKAGWERAFVEPELVADFLAVGYCRLQVELLIREMRSSRHLAEAQFDAALVEGAAAAVAGDRTKAREKLVELFDLLLEARDHFYPVDAFVIDVTLTADTTLGPSLRRELQRSDPTSTPTNLLLSAERVEQIASEHPSTLRALSEAIGSGSIELIGGLPGDAADTTAALEEILEELNRARRTYDRWIAGAPRVFGSFHPVLSPRWPQTLRGCGYQGVLLAAFDGSPLPRSDQCKIRWQSADGSTIETLAVVPLDSARSESFLRFALALSRSMDRDFVATVCLAHWPAAACIWMDDLRRISAYSPVLGRFVKLSAYLERQGSPDRIVQFGSPSPAGERLEAHVSANQSDPISGPLRDAQRRALEQARRNLCGLHWLTAPRDLEAAPADRGSGWDEAVERLARAVGARPGLGKLLVNPWSAALPAGAAGPVPVPPLGYAWHAATDAAAPAAGTFRESPEKTALAESRPTTLANEFLTLEISPRTGGIQVLRDPEHRDNRLSQRLAVRRPDGAAAAGDRPGESATDGHAPAVYSRMEAESIARTVTLGRGGTIRSRGSLVGDGGQPWARFEQRTSVWPGSRLVEIEIDLEMETPRSAPWGNYGGIRFAWANESAVLWRGLAMGRETVEGERIEAADYLEIDGAGGGRMFVFAGGLPYHVRCGERMLDTLLVCAGETCRSFRLWLAVGDCDAAGLAQALALPRPWPAARSDRPAAGDSAWLMHIDAIGVVLTSLEAIDAAKDPRREQASDPAGIRGESERSSAEPAGHGQAPGGSATQVRGIRIRLLETQGRGGKVTVEMPQPLLQARQSDLTGRVLRNLSVDGPRVGVEIDPYGWIQLEAFWETQ